MIWKDQYKLGIKEIDLEHYRLFFQVERLLHLVQTDVKTALRNECIEFIDNFKVNIRKHFKDEELYQRKSNYLYLEEHVKQHDKFYNSLLEYEKMIKQSDYDEKLINDFLASVILWLLHHVGEVDQTMVNGKPIYIDEVERKFKYQLIDAAQATFEKMFDIAVYKGKEMLYKSHLDGDIFVKVKVKGPQNALVVFAYPKETARRLVARACDMKLDNMDNLILSAMGETTDIVVSRVCSQLSGTHYQYLITPPKVTVSAYEGEGTKYMNDSSVVKLVTQAGSFEVLVKEIE